MLPYNGALKQLSRLLRENMTDAEKCLWMQIRMKQLSGYQFYRQKPIDDYIVDFFCPKAKLVIEVDGSQHFSDEMIEYDRIRNKYLSSLGLRVLRFTNADIMTNSEGVLESIFENIEKSPLSPPFSKGEIAASPFVKGRRERDLSGLKVR
ncbi:MAG: endonuclease domain-containing protein [Chloroflexota bacterium]